MLIGCQPHKVFFCVWILSKRVLSGQTGKKVCPGIGCLCVVFCYVRVSL